MSVVVIAACVGWFLGGNHDPAVVGLLVVALVVIAASLCGAMQPPLVHVHSNEGVKHGSRRRSRSTQVLRERLDVIDPKPVSGGQSVSDC
jgi:hypothetical protein